MPKLAEINEIVRKANTAPAGDNCQPWFFLWQSETLYIFHNNIRAKHRLNFADSASMLAFGCLKEAIKIAATEFSLSSNFTLVKKNEAGSLQNAPKEILARLESKELTLWGEAQFNSGAIDKDPLLDAIERRHTNRSLYKEASLSEEQRAYLQKISNEYENCTLRIQESVDHELENYLIRMEEFIVQDKLILLDLIQWIRFSWSERNDSRDGMYWKNLIVAYPDVLILKYATKFKLVAKILHSSYARSTMRKQFQSQLKSSAALVQVSVRGDTSLYSLMDAGSLMYRAWIYLNQNGFGVQPLTISSVNIFNVISGFIQNEVSEEFNSLCADGRKIFKNSFQINDDELPAWMFRTGKAADLPDSYRTIRKNQDEIFLAP